MVGESSNWQSYGPLVRDRIWHQAEGPGLDKKREHYYFDEGMKDDDGREVIPCERRREFLKDAIALANAACRQREEVYLCLGIAEYEDWTIWGVEGKHPRHEPNTTWADVEAHPDLMNQWAEEIQKEYTNLVRNYVRPYLPDIHYETGWEENHLIGLLVIKPIPSPAGFYITDDGRKRGRLQALGLEPGCSWRRLGAITEPIKPDQRERILRALYEYPYISLAGWRSYLGELSKHVPDDPNQPNPYQPLRGCWNDNRVDDIMELLDQFAHSSAMPNVLLVVGAPGCGKTTLLERLARDLAFEASQAIESTHGRPYVKGQLRALDYPKGAPVPVLIKLWGFEYSRQDRPEMRFCQAMTDRAGDTLKLDQHASPASILKDRDLNFVVMLDGLDEISRRQRQRTLNALVRFIKDHPHARFIVTCRSDQLQDMGPDWGAYSQLHVESMHPVQARQYLGGTTWKTLLDRDDILTSTLQLLCNPRRISVLRETKTTTQNLGTVLENAIGGFLAEEHKKYVYSQEDRSKLERRVNRFAFWLLEQELRGIGEEAAHEFLKSKYFDWLYRAGLLVSHQGYWGFTEPIVHDYFVARQLLELCRSRKLSPAIPTIAAQPVLWQRAIQIAANLWPEDLTDEPMASLLNQLQPEEKLQVIAERRFSTIGDATSVEAALGEYLQQVDANPVHAEQLLRDQDLSVQRATIEVVRTAHYLPAANTLYDLGSLLPQDSELRWLVASVLTDLGDQRGEELQPSVKEDEEPETIPEADGEISAIQLEIGTLAQIGG